MTRDHSSDQAPPRDSGTGPEPLQLRPLDPAADRELIEQACYENFNWSGIERITREQIAADPTMAHYADLGPKDFGLVATLGETPVGLVWCQYADPAHPGYGFVAIDAPELSICVFADHRGQGIGSALLGAIVEEAVARRVAGISLSVEVDNPAAGLYANHGWRTVAAGEYADVMLLALPLR